MIILTALEQAQLTENKKKTEVNCSFEDVKVSIRSNEDVRDWNHFSSVWSYCMEQTDGQLLCPTKHAPSKQMSLCNPTHSQLGKPETQLAGWAPRNHPPDGPAQPTDTLHHCQTWEIVFSTSPRHLFSTSSHLKGSELPHSAGSRG